MSYYCILDVTKSEFGSGFLYISEFCSGFLGVCLFIGSMIDLGCASRALDVVWLGVCVWMS